MRAHEKHKVLRVQRVDEQHQRVLKEQRKVAEEGHKNVPVAKRAEEQHQQVLKEQVAEEGHKKVPMAKRA